MLASTPARFASGSIYVSALADYWQYEQAAAIRDQIYEIEKTYGK